MPWQLFKMKMKMKVKVKEEMKVNGKTKLNGKMKEKVICGDMHFCQRSCTIFRIDV